MGSGRVLGSKNKNRMDANAIADELGVNPFRVLLHIVNGDWKAIGLKSQYVTKYTAKGDPYEEDAIQMDHRLTAAKEAAKYVLPQQKAIEHSASDGTSLLAPIIAAPNSVKPEAMGGMGVSDGQPNE